MTTRPSKRAVVAIFVDGDRQYGGGWGSTRQWTTTRGSAMRYDTELDARYHAYKLKESFRRIEDVMTEEIKNPRATFQRMCS